MKFEDENINELNLELGKDFYILIVEYLCGNVNYVNWDVLKPIVKDNFERIISHINKIGVNYQQFNEMLLLIGEDRMSNAFFDTFFAKGKGIVNVNEFVNGIVFFRGIAMLLYGNFRHTYKKFIKMQDSNSFKYILKEYLKLPEVIKKEYLDRLEKAINIKIINRKDTYFNGYLTKKNVEIEMKELSKRNDENESGLEEVVTIYDELGKKINEIQDIALYNTDIFLTWDFMDIYIATSMRNTWEFEETHDFINVLFNLPEIKELNLRYFDPTQSNCLNRINKGLVESLMLKRAKCTIYMIQENDTLGKDSELAATLAQGKPVIAFIPVINEDEHKNKISSFPLEYFKKRIYILRTEGIFEDKDIVEELKLIEEDFNDTLNEFVDKYSKFREKHPFTFWMRNEELFFKNIFKKSDLLFKIITKAEKYYFDKRANVLKKNHPLSFQVNLDSGVANGVLVVRDIKQCANLLLKLFTNDLGFTLKKVDVKERGISKFNTINDEFSKYPGLTLLIEDISDSPYRVISNFERLDNSFWNFYLKK